MLRIGPRCGLFKTVICIFSYIMILHVATLYLGQQRGVSLTELQRLRKRRGSKRDWAPNRTRQSGRAISHGPTKLKISTSPRNVSKTLRTKPYKS
jgi:hypothetical protein